MRCGAFVCEDIGLQGATGTSARYTRQKYTPFGQYDIIIVTWRSPFYEVFTSQAVWTLLRGTRACEGAMGLVVVGIFGLGESNQNVVVNNEGEQLIWDWDWRKEERPLRVYSSRWSICRVTCAGDVSCVDVQFGVCKDIMDTLENLVDFSVSVSTIPPALNDGPTVTMEFDMVF
ncbi:hypothetical protein ARMGADRAFT_1040655 [Armillaria gallica]|uniref:Uncharacterized protein n=1 Tax=Armillaria gallica TaxID=47427 RepID=A0A2H3CSB5_ARMGA|nr:hypothetical protein ARMGADRAFT_1040655 [Armillaria gallica]